MQFTYPPYQTRNNIPIYIQKSKEAIRADKYEQYNPSVIRSFSTLESSFGYQVSSIIYDSLDQVKCNAVLELGCATGNLIANIALKYPQKSCLGIDYSFQMLNMAQKLYKNEADLPLEVKGFQNGQTDICVQSRNIENLHFAQCDATDLPLKNQSIDFCYSSFLWDRVKNPPFLLKEKSRILTLGGFCIMLTPLNYVNNRHWFQWPEAKNIVDIASMYHLTCITHKSFNLKEVLDIRGNKIVWNTEMFIFKKTT